MAENQKPKFDLPWATLLPVLAAIAGVVAQYKPLVSTRPTIAAEKPVPVIAAQDVDARLWQDPIAVAQKQKSALAGMSTGAVPKDRAEAHDISALVELLRTRATNIQGCLLLLGVMIDAGPYSEQGESRLRARQAVLEGLSESGFVPVDGEHIGYVTSPWPVPSEHLANSADSVANSGLLLPWEECEAGERENVVPAGTERVIILWLPATNFNPEPLNLFAQLIDVLAPHDIRDKIDVKLLGPANSAGLQKMVREVRADKWNKTRHDALDGVWIFSARATAADDTLLYDPSLEPAATAGPTPTTVKEVLEQAVPRDGPGVGLHFVRTIATDEVVLGQLISELKLRHVDVESEPGNCHSAAKTPHVVLLREWDTPFARSLGTTFLLKAYHVSSPDEIFARRTSRFRPRRIHTYRYLRGIDGQLPGDAARGSSQEQARKSTFGPDTVAIESTEGLNHADYLRRLARVLKENDTQWRRADCVGIGAIGLLGSDIYDKLMILRALRPQFPGTIFFTNTYDAHFERRDDLDDTHNLIIGSPFGGELPTNFSRRQRSAPFRDSNQTALFAATLVATGRMEEKAAAALSTQPRIFEIGRRGAYDLSAPWRLKGEYLVPSNKTWFWDWLRSDHVQEHLVVGAIFLALIVAWVTVSIANRALPRGGTTSQRLGRVASSTAFWIVCGTPIIVFAITAFAQSDLAAPEPLAFFSGISIWPSEMLRLIAFMLAIHFMIKAGIDLRANERDLAKRFCLDPREKNNHDRSSCNERVPLPATRFCWRDLGLGLDLWRTPSKEGELEPEFSAPEAWQAYLRRNKFWPRFLRIGILFTMYLTFSYSLFSLFPPLSTPARGEVAFQFDFAVFLVTTITMMILTFYVVDAIQLNSNFIRMFAREVTKWGRDVTEQSHRSPPLSEEELSAYHEIFFVAQRTEVVARLIWYPLIVLTLMVVARSSFFDNWTWPVSLILIYAFNAAWAIGSAILLRRAAEHLRDAAISNLQLLRVISSRSWILKRHEIAEKQQVFDELIAEIRGLKKGAFAPWTEQPFVRAVLFPGGGLGLLAVAQRLLDIF